MPFECACNVHFSKEQVVIALGRGLFGSHLGLAFHTFKDGPKVLHLRTHKQLAVDPYPEGGQCWAVHLVDLPPRASKQFVGIVRGLAAKRPHVGYGLNFLAGKDAFDEKGTYKPPKGFDGFTCSTLIAEIFRFAALPLLDTATWLPNPKNTAWEKAVCCMLENTGVDLDHVESVCRNACGIRVRPEEVASAAAMPIAARPAKFDAVILDADAALSIMRQICPEWPVPSHLAKCVETYETGLVGDLKSG